MSGIPENGADGDATWETGMLRRGAASAEGLRGRNHSWERGWSRRPYQTKREERDGETEGV